MYGRGPARSNTHLRDARRRLQSPSGSGRPMSRQELADAINAVLFERHAQRSGLDENYIGKLERGKYRWPNDRYREAFRTVLGAKTDAEIGFYITRDADVGIGERAGVHASEHHQIGALSSHIQFAHRTIVRETSAKLPDRTEPLRIDTLLAGSAIVDWLADGRHSPQQFLAFPSGRFFAGTTIEARIYPTTDSGHLLAAVPNGHEDDHFLRRPRRGLVVGITEDRAGVRLFGLDTRHARRRQRDRSDEQLPMLTPCLLDDLTLGVLWAVANLDEALLNDDQVLAECQQHMTQFEGLLRSAAGHDLAADLAPVSAMWLGSEFCARHVRRHIREAQQVPAFWTREQRGEEASTWLLFAHKYEYLRRLASQFPDAGMIRTFCIPPDTVTGSSKSERLLLLLATALMESFGIAVQIAAEPEYATVDGFVLDAERRAIVANWVGGDGIWQVDVTTAKPTVREYADASDHARARSAIAAPTSVDRLHGLAVYLDLDWPWLTARCADLAQHGLAVIAEPRSRLLSLAGVDRACRYLDQLSSVNR